MEEVGKGSEQMRLRKEAKRDPEGAREVDQKLTGREEED